MLMLSRANLLVLDEPTNHLDVESIEALEDAIERFGGTVLLVSHDRELLRALTTRVWLLHERHIIEFDGGFAEWEQVSAERTRSAAVRASEEETLRRVHERQRLRAATRGDDERQTALRRSLRDARQVQAGAEARVSELEARVAALTAALEDPALYTRPNGVDEARVLGADLDAARHELDTALEQWTTASERVDALAADGAG
jgi:ATP-binding cassette subfamily F protein 3